MIKTTIITPIATYNLTIEKTRASVALIIKADHLPTKTTFELQVNDAATATYFSQYLSGELASRFTANMPNADFMSNLQALISQVLANWSCYNNEIY